MPTGRTAPIPLLPEAERSWALLAHRIARERDPRRRANLQVVVDHVAAEVRGDLDALMATLVDEPSYTVSGASNSPGPQGQDEVLRFYEESIAIGKNRLEYEVDRVVVDEDSVVTDGIFRHAYSGAMLASRGIGDGLDEDTWYLVEYRCLVTWPISSDGRIEGEALFAGEVPRVVRALADAECPHLGPVLRAEVMR